MRNRKLAIGLRVVLAILTAAQFVAATRALGYDGAYPAGGLTRDAKGNLYGTTTRGGHNDGTVFVLTPKAGVWAQHILYSFNSQDKGGYDPYFGSLIFDGSGNLYGTTQYGGAKLQGTVFELKRPAHGVVWTENLLHSFSSGSDGSVPFAGVIFDAAGNLYGTTYGGGNGSECNRGGCGTVFQLTPGTNGGWTEAVTHSFNNGGTDGYYPWASLVLDGSGNLYGTTFYGGSGGGSYGYGTVYELTPAVGGGWTEAVLYSFSNTDGANPVAGLIFDAAGNLYGTTVNGGAYGYGTVFELTPAGGGNWTEAVLYSFSNADGAGPFASLIFDAAGNLYGTTFAGGTYGYGTVFELTPAAGGSWTEKVLHNFGHGKDGGWLYGPVIRDKSGNLYGTTYAGGAHRYGTVFELTPTAGGGWTEKVLHNFNLY